MDGDAYQSRACQAVAGSRSSQTVLLNATWQRSVTLVRGIYGYSGPLTLQAGSYHKVTQYGSKRNQMMTLIKGVEHMQSTRLLFSKTTRVVSIQRRIHSHQQRCHVPPGR